MNWCVYYIKNLKNQKGYVGITNCKYKNAFDRFNDHLKYASSKHVISSNGIRYPLSAAIIKYGAHNFECEILESYLCLFEAQEREIHWIKELNTYASGYSKNGYNLTYGGEMPDFDPDESNFN